MLNSKTSENASVGRFGAALAKINLLTKKIVSGMRPRPRTNAPADATLPLVHEKATALTDSPDAAAHDFTLTKPTAGPELSAPLPREIRRRARRSQPDTVPIAVVAATQVSNAVIDELQLIGAEVLGRLLGRPTKSIRVDIHRRPETLPPRFVIPGTRKLLWRTSDVKRWMDDLAEAEVDRIALKKRAAKQASRY